jgi:adenine-specific DNA-methyltransferase
MEQNHLDGGHRQAILCTNNENNIAREVTYRRLRNVIEGYQHFKNYKETLFKLPLNVKNIVNNTPILMARDKYCSQNYLNRYYKITEEVRKDTYYIFGVIKKTEKITGLGNSLRFYRTGFAEKNDCDAHSWISEIEALTGKQLPGKLSETL